MRAILIDDEQLALDYLEHQLHELGNVRVIGKYINPIVGKEAIISQDVDVAFLDINLPEINGLELAEQLLEKKPELIVVFVTAYDQYAVDAFELNALDYIVKPLTKERVKKTLLRVANHLQVQKDSPQPKEEKSVRIYVCNQLTIEKDEGQVAFSWRTKKANELFLFLLHHRGQLISKGALVELLWPELEADKAYSQLYTTIYHVRKELKKYKGHIQVTNMSEGYRLKLMNVQIDIDEWEKGLQSAPPLQAESIQVYLDVMKNYTGPYLQAYDYLWLENERYRFERLWIETCFKIAAYYHKNKSWAAAILWYKKVCTAYPETEDAHFSLMKIYATINDHIHVRQQYEKLKQFLDEEFGVLPNEKINVWYESWEKNHHALL
ncbi:response regulator [Virgibacillus sp. MG-45]|uniref:response regulator n=1 Tax=Virgibacillus sp. MG-45 TaxID=3102791 RepID=UPI002ED77907